MKSAHFHILLLYFSKAKTIDCKNLSRMSLEIDKMLVIVDMKFRQFNYLIYKLFSIFSWVYLGLLIFSIQLLQLHKLKLREIISHLKTFDDLFHVIKEDKKKGRDTVL